MSSWVILLVVVAVVAGLTVIRMRLHRLRVTGRSDAIARRKHATTAALIALGLAVVVCLVVALLL